MPPFFVHPVYLWLIVMVLCAIIEVFTLSFALLSFSIAAGFASLTALLGGNLYIELIVFSVVSVLSLIFVRPIALKILFNKKNQTKLGTEAYIDQQYKLIETLNNINNTGKVKIGSEIWTARTRDQEIIDEGEVVRVRAIEGTTLYVEKINIHKE